MARWGFLIVGVLAIAAMLNPIVPFWFLAVTGVLALLATWAFRSFLAPINNANAPSSTTAAAGSGQPALPKETAIFHNGRWVLPASLYPPAAQTEEPPFVCTEGLEWPSREHTSIARPRTAPIPVSGPPEPYVVRAAPPTPTPRTPISKSTRHAVFARDRYTCQRCGASGRDRGVQLVIDHKKPLKRGGTNAMSNLQTLCSKCNAEKGAKNTGYGDLVRE